MIDIKRRLISILVLALLCLQLPALRSSLRLLGEEGGSLFLSGDKAEDVPFRLVDDRIYIPVTIEGKARLWIYDSGTARNCIDLEYARQLGLVTESKLKARGSSGKVEASFVTLPPLGAPGVRLPAQQAVAFPLRDLFRHHMGLDVVGILGYDFISRLVTRIDFAGRRLSFYDPRTFVYRGAGRVLPAPLHDNQPTIEATIDGRWRGRFYVDTGSSKLELHYPFAARIGLLKGPGVDLLGGGVGGDSRDRARRFRSIEFGDWRIERPLMIWPLERPEGSFAESAISGNLGNPLLRRFVVYFDYAHQRIILEKGADFASDLAEDHSGLQLACSDGGGLIVRFVSPGTPAARAGLQAGDRVVAIDGKRAENFAGLPAARELLQGEAGTIVRLRVVRRDRVWEKRLILGELFAGR